MPSVDPAPWHIDPISRDDDLKLSQIMARRSAVTGETVTKAGTVRRAVRKLWEEEVNGGE